MRRLFHFLIIFVILFSGCSGFKKKYSVAIDPTFYPANLGGSADNVYGMMIDLLEEIAREEGVIIQCIQSGTESLLNGLQRNSYDAVMTTKYNLGVETNIYSTSKPALMTGPVLVTLVQSDFSTISRDSEKIIGVVAQSDAQLLVQKYPKVVIARFLSEALLMEALKNGLIDGAVLGVIPAKSFSENVYQGYFKINPKPLSDEGIMLVTMVDKHPSLIALFNSGYKKAKKSKVLSRLLTKWNVA